METRHAPPAGFEGGVGPFSQFGPGSPAAHGGRVLFRGSSGDDRREVSRAGRGSYFQVSRGCAHARGRNGQRRENEPHPFGRPGSSQDLGGTLRPPWTSGVGFLSTEGVARAGSGYFAKTAGSATRGKSAQRPKENAGSRPRHDCSGLWRQPARRARCLRSDARATFPGGRDKKCASGAGLKARGRFSKEGR